MSEASGHVQKSDSESKTGGVGGAPNDQKDAQGRPAQAAGAGDAEEPKASTKIPDDIRNAMANFRAEKRRSSMSVIEDKSPDVIESPRYTSFRVRDQSLRLRPRDQSHASIANEPRNTLLSKLPSMQSAASFVMPSNIQQSFIGSKSRKRAREHGSLELLATELTDGEAKTVDSSMRTKASSIMMSVASSQQLAGAGLTGNESARAGASAAAAAAAATALAKSAEASNPSPATSTGANSGEGNNLAAVNSRRSLTADAIEKRNSFLNAPRPSFIGKSGTSKAKYEEILRQRSEMIQDKRANGDSNPKAKDRPIFFEPPMATQDLQHHYRKRAENNDVQRMFSGAGATSESERKAEMNRFTALQRRAARTNTSTTPVSFYDVVETEAEPQASNTDFSERLAGRITESSGFQNFILGCIIVNTFLSILYTEPHIEQQYGRLIDQADSVFLTIYLMEIWLKMIYQKASFWLDNWNIFDFSLIFVSLLSTFIRDIGSRSSIDGRVLRFLRVLRAFRTLRILGALRKLQVVVNTFLKSLMELTNIVVMILLLIFMFAIMGLQLFQEYSPKYFGTLTQSAMTLFVCITQEGWVDITDEVFESVENSAGGVDVPMSFIMHAFFIIYVTIGAWTMINLISGITVTNWQLYVDEMKAMERARYHEIELPSLRDDQIVKETRAVSAKTINPEVWGKQIPLASASSIGRISVQKLENYMLVLDALEMNMKEYKDLKQNLRGHLEVIQSTNSILDVTLLERESSETRFNGDVLSIQMMQPRPSQATDVDQRPRNATRRSGARRGSAVIMRTLMG